MYELFQILILNFSLKEKTMRNINNQNVAELAHYIICRGWVPTSAIRMNFSLAFLFLGLLKPLLLHLI